MSSELINKGIPVGLELAGEVSKVVVEEVVSATEQEEAHKSGHCCFLTKLREDSEG